LLDARVKPRMTVEEAIGLIWTGLWLHSARQKRAVPGTPSSANAV